MGLVLREVGGGQPVADDHVRTFFQHGRAQGRRLRSRIGVVPVHHQITVRLDVTEHGPHHVALALTGLGAHDGTGLTGQTGRFVGGIVVIDIDIGIRQGLTVIPDHVPDGQSVFGNFSFYSYKKACGQKKTVRGSKNSRRLSNGTPAI